MTIFLTSSPGGSYKEGGRRIPCRLDDSNGFSDNLKAHWRDNPECLLISSDPDNIEMNDSMCDLFEQAFEMTGLPLSCIRACDSRNEKSLPDLIRSSDLIILSGGHVPTQNAFFERIGLRKLIHGFTGIIIGVSAGTMNSADTVYAQPELDGEAADPDYQRFLTGLGLTDLMILPHYEDDGKDAVLDGLRVMEDITYPDSIGRKIYALPDGSYVKIDGGSAILFGEAYLVQDGVITQICTDNQHIALEQNIV